VRLSAVLRYRLPAGSARAVGNAAAHGSPVVSCVQREVDFQPNEFGGVNGVVAT
jgi:hypothetical protein